MSATIKYNSYEFQKTGRPHYSSSASYESPTEGGVRDRRSITYTITHWFLEETFADNEARYRQLLVALKTTEGVLFIADENGTELVNQRVRVATDDLPDQWGQALKEVRVTFTGTEDLTGSSSPFDATYQSAAGGAAVTLPNVTSFKEAIRADRFSIAVPNRREAIGVATASGLLRANQTDAPAERRAYLLAQKAAIEAVIDSEEGTLVYGDFSKLVRIDSLEADIKGGTDELTWSLVVSYRRFPGGDYAEADYEVDQNDDLEKQERNTVVRGTIRADDQAGAETKRDTIRNTFATGRILRRKASTAKVLDGVDGTGTFVELSFAFEFRELLEAQSYKLSISTRDDLRSGQIVITYSGTVQAATSSAALIRARALGDGKYPMRLSSTETVGTASTDGSEELLSEVTFAYEYLTKGSAQYAEVTGEIDRQTFGSSGNTVSGFAVAATETVARALARSFKPTNLLQRADRESVETLHTSETRFVKVTFSYSFHLAAIAGSIQFSKRTVEDYENREVGTTWSGTAWAQNEASADALINGLLVGVPGRKGANDRASNFDSATQTAFVSRTFTVSRIAALASSGDDILIADYSVDSTYSINATVLTPIPFGVAFVQPAVGVIPGVRVVSGSITALNLNTARAWARTKMPTGGYADPPREKEGALFYPLSGTAVKAYRMEFTYAMRYPNLVMA